MYHLSKQFAEYCEIHFNLTEQEHEPYRSLSVCIIDCVYSLRAKYYSTTVPVVERYAARYMDGDKDRYGDTVSMLLRRMDENGGPQQFAENVLKNHQKLGGKSKIPKENICFQLAQYLKALHIDTLEDFQNFASQELLEIVIRSVKGLGDAGVNYLFMLAGDPNRCKPDVHIHQCIRDACGCSISNEDCQILFQETVQQLKKEHPNLTVRGLDGIIWRSYQNKS